MKMKMQCTCIKGAPALWSWIEQSVLTWFVTIMTHGVTACREDMGRITYAASFTCGQQITILDLSRHMLLQAGENMQRALFPVK